MNGFSGRGTVGDRAIQRISRIISAAFGPATVIQSTAPDEFDSPPLLFGDTYQEEVLRSDRISVASDCWAMYHDDPRVRSQMDEIGDDATASDRNGRPWEVVFKDPDETEELKADLDVMIDRKGIALRDRADEIIKWTLVGGNRFFRIVVDLNTNKVSELRYIKGIREGFVTVRQDKIKEYDGWWVQYETQSRRAVAVFAPWEVVHFGWNIENIYGISMLSSGRRNYKRLAASEKDMWIARKERAYMKIGYQFPDATKEEIQALAKEATQARKGGSSGITSDLFATGPISAIDPSNSALGNIADVQHSELQLFATMRRPSGLLGGYGTDMNRATLDRKEAVYMAGLIDKVCRMAGAGFKKVINTQMALSGVLVEDYPYDINWTPKSGEDKKDMSERLRDAHDRKVISGQTYAAELGYDANAERERIETEMEWRAEMQDKLALNLGAEGGEL